MKVSLTLKKILSKIWKHRNVYVTFDSMNATEQLNHIIKNKGLRKDWLSKQVGLSRTHFSLVVCGKRPVSQSLKDKIEALYPDVKFLDHPFCSASPESGEPLPHEQIERDKEAAKHLFDNPNNIP